MKNIQELDLSSTEDIKQININKAHEEANKINNRVNTMMNKYNIKSQITVNSIQAEEDIRNLFKKYKIKGFSKQILHIKTNDLFSRLSGNNEHLGNDGLSDYDSYCITGEETLSNGSFDLRYHPESNSFTINCIFAGGIKDGYCDNLNEEVRLVTEVNKLVKELQINGFEVEVLKENGEFLIRFYQSQPDIHKKELEKLFEILEK